MFINYTKYTHVQHVPHAEHAFTGQQVKWITQVPTQKSSPVVFQPIVEQLTFFYISGLIL